MSKGTIRVTLHGHLWRLTESQSREVLLPWREGFMVRGLLEELGIPSEQVMIVLVNGNRIKEDRAIEPGDHLEVLPVINGG